MSKQTQAEQILKFLQENKEGITPVDAFFKFNCFRLGARIFDLKALGHKITMELEQGNGSHYARYRLQN